MDLMFNARSMCNPSLLQPLDAADVQCIDHGPGTISDQLDVAGRNAHSGRGLVTNISLYKSRAYNTCTLLLCGSRVCVGEGAWRQSRRILLESDLFG